MPPGTKARSDKPLALGGSAVCRVPRCRVHHNDDRESRSGAERSAASADGFTDPAGTARRRCAVNAPQPAVSGPSTFPAGVRGSDSLGDSDVSARPADCVGVGYLTQRNVYRSVEVKSVARVSWRHDGSSVKVDDLDEGVVALPSAAAADDLFARFSAQWKECDGTTLTVPASAFGQRSITDVRVADSVSRQRSRCDAARTPYWRPSLRPVPSAYGAIAWSRSRSPSLASPTRRIRGRPTSAPAPSISHTR